MAADERRADRPKGVVWLEPCTVEATGWAMSGIIDGSDPVYSIRQADGGLYWPHENGEWPECWCAVPDWAS